MPDVDWSKYAARSPSPRKRPAAPRPPRRVAAPAKRAPVVAAACFTTPASLPLRYSNNVFHQAELVYPMVVAALERGAPPVIHWRFGPPLNWSRGMLQLLVGRAQLRTDNSTSVAGCTSFGRSSAPGAYWPQSAGVAERAAKLVRDRAYAACGVHRRSAAAASPSIVYMPRAGEGLQSGARRNFDRSLALTAALEPLGRLRTAPTPGGETPVCEQISLWASADAVVTPNGAHFVNAIFLPPSAVLVEGVPWAMAAYEGQPTITIHSGIHHVRVYSSRPPALQPAALRHGLADSTEARCAADEVCKRRYRDHANIYVPAEAVVALLRAHLGCRDDPKWGHNGYGKRCHEYEYPRQPATPKGAERGAGWCAAGALKPGSEWAGGASFRYPERACCACGGGIRDSG